jgi:hypothetical protein
MNAGPKIALWVGIAFVAFSSTLPSWMMFKLGLADMVVPPSWEGITIGLCCITGALVAWKAGRTIDENSN